MQGQAIPGARLVIEINLANEVYPYNKNPFTSLAHANTSSRGGLRYMADKAKTAIMETSK